MEIEKKSYTTILYNPDNYAVMANEIIKGKQEMTLQEARLIRLLITQIAKQNKDLKTYVIKIKDLADFLGIDSSNLYKRIRDLCRQLLKRTIDINTGNPKEPWKSFQWIQLAEYDGNGNLTIMLSNQVQPYLLELNAWFTKYKLKNILTMSSFYSIRIYELLKLAIGINKNHHSKQYYNFKIAYLREILGCTTKFKQIIEFKRKVLDISIYEINEKTDLLIDLEYIKTGRKVTAINFFVQEKPDIKPNGIEQNLISDEIQPDTPISKNLPAAEPLVNLPPVIAEIPAKSNLVPDKQPESVIDIDDLLDTLRNIIKKPLKTKELKEILAVANNDLNLINSKYELSQNKDIDDLKSWIINAIKNDYKEPVKPESIKHTDTPVIQSPASASPPDETLIEAVRNIIKEPIPNNDIKAILDIAHGNLDVIMDKYSLATKCKVNNITGFLISAISKDYSENYIPSSPTRPLNRFTNYPQRVYDFPKMEALEMELNKMEYNKSMAKESEEAERLKNLKESEEAEASEKPKESEEAEALKKLKELEEAEALKKLKESEEAEALKKLKELEEAERLKRHEESEKRMASIIEREKREALEKVEEQKRFRRRRLFLNLQYAQLENNFEEAERIQAEMDSI